MEPARWQSELQSAGFAEPVTVLDDEEHQLNAVMIAKPAVINPERISKAVTIMSDEGVKSAEALSQQLQSRGYKVDLCQHGGDLPKSQDVISILDESGPFENTSDTRFKAFQQLLAHLGQSGLLWITRPSQMQCNDPRHAQVIGAARSIRNEEYLDFATCEVDSSESLDTVIDVFDHFQRRQEDEFFRPEYEYAISNGLVHVPRIYPFSFKDESLSESSAQSRVTLELETPGRLSSLRWVSRGAKELLGNQVEVQVSAAGLSYNVGNHRPSRPKCANFLNRTFRKSWVTLHFPKGVWVWIQALWSRESVLKSKILLSATVSCVWVLVILLRTWSLLMHSARGFPTHFHLKRPPPRWQRCAMSEIYGQDR